MSCHAPSSPTHVSESLPTSSEAPGAASQEAAREPREPREQQQEQASKDPVDKELLVVEYVVGALLADKKRKLAEMIQSDFEELSLEKQCASLKDKRLELQRLEHMRWPQLEKELVRDLARTLCESRRTHTWCAKQLMAVTHENAVLRARLAVVASAF
jgi:anti-sigma-K factor RskA